MQLSDTDLLTKIKTALHITGTYQDEALNIYIAEVKEFMKSAGVKESIVNSEVSVGCILRGVTDAWNYGSGTPYYSQMFKQRVIQLALKQEEPNQEGNSNV